MSLGGKKACGWGAPETEGSRHVMKDLKWWKWLSLAALVLIVVGLVQSGVIKLWPTPGFFHFNDGTVQGWTVDATYDGDTPDHVPGFVYTGPAFWDGANDVRNEPEHDPKGDVIGSASYYAGPGNPDPGEVTTGTWRFDFVSPDLSGEPDWQGVQGLSVHVADTASVPGVSNGDDLLSVRFLLETTAPDGSIVLVDEVAGGQVVVHTLPAVKSHQWIHLTAQLPVPTGHTLRHVRVRVFGTAVPKNSGVYDGGVVIDDVDPF
jgi:hypothetical protein